MNLVQAISYIQLYSNEEITKKEFAKKVNVTEQALQPYRKDSSKQIPDSWISFLEKEYGYIFPSQKNVLNASNKFITVPYWSCGNPRVDEMVKSDDYTEFLLDLQFVIKKKLKPENRVVVAMIGEEMDGGFYPLKNKDILLIDTSRNHIYESGVFFCTSHNNSRVYIRRFVEVMTEGIHAITTVDNPVYKNIVEKQWNKNDWVSADIKVIGRVVKNMSYVC